MSGTSDTPKKGDLVVVVDPGRSLYVSAGMIGRVVAPPDHGWPVWDVHLEHGLRVVRSVRHPTPEELAAYQLAQGC